MHISILNLSKTKGKSFLDSSKIGKDKELELVFLEKEKSMKDNTRKIKKMERVYKCIPMATFISEIFLEERSMGVGVFFGLAYPQLEIQDNNLSSIIKANGGEDCLMDLVHIKKSMVTYTLELSKMDWNMAKEHNCMEMAIFIRESLSMDTHKDMESILGQMEASLKVIFSKENVVAMEFGKQEKTVLNLIKDIFI